VRQWRRGAFRSGEEGSGQVGYRNSEALNSDKVGQLRWILKVRVWGSSSWKAEGRGWVTMDPLGSGAAGHAGMGKWRLSNESLGNTQGGTAKQRVSGTEGLLDIGAMGQ
jgi:hypothetical protein